MCDMSSNVLTLNPSALEMAQNTSSASAQFADLLQDEKKYLKFTAYTTTDVVLIILPLHRETDLETHLYPKEQVRQVSIVMETTHFKQILGNIHRKTEI